MQKVGVFVICVLSFFVPLWFLPITSEFYDFNKQVLLIAGALALLLTLSIHWLKQKQIKVLHTPLDATSLLLMISLLLSTIIFSPNKLDAILDPGQVGTYLASMIIAFAIANIVRTKRDFEQIFSSFLLSTFVLSLIAILWGTGLATRMLPTSLSAFSSELWSPTGSSINLIIFLVVGLVLAGFNLIRTKANSATGVLLAGFIFVNLIALGITGYNYRPVFLSPSTGWAIALEVLKTSPILGSGPGTFLSDFTRFRPVTFNTSPNWTVRFATSSNQYLQILTLTGFLGLIAYGLWTIKLLSLARKSFYTADVHAMAIAAAAIFMTIIGLFVPFTTMGIFLTFAIAGLLVASHRLSGISTVYESSLDIVAGTSNKTVPILPWTMFIVSITLTVGTTFGMGLVFYGEFLFQKSLMAASINDGKTTYDTLIEAIKINPYKDNYRVAYSQTNMLIANTLATGKNISEQDRATITQLVQQAIREAKNAITLSPDKVTNMENLAGIYRSLLNFAQGADAWTIAAYQQAIILDPINPNLRIALGGVFYSQKNYDDAVRVFQSAVDVKPDYANAHYNLALAYKEKKQNEAAIASLEKTLALLEKSSEDYAKASKELEELKATLPPVETKKTSAPSQLTTPEATLPKPKITPPLPAAAIAPDATPSATPAPTPSPLP